MPERSPPPRQPTPEERLKTLTKNAAELAELSKIATEKAEKILEDYKQDPLAPGFLQKISAFTAWCQQENISAQSLLKVPLGNDDPYEFYANEIKRIRLELWNALPPYAKEALIEGRKKIRPEEQGKMFEFEKSMIHLCRAYQRDPKIFSEKNVREALGLSPK